jgi:[protein-PII] uridylyltransferase
VTETPTPFERRRQRANAADERLRSLWDDAAGAVGCPATGASLVAVGGYGRGELSPRSDLDVVLLVADALDDDLVAALAEKVWYPLWDDNVALDHSVRTEHELRAAADDDFRVALGLVDMRHVAGDPALTLGARATVLAEWRRAAKRRLPVIAAATRDRWHRVGDLGHATAPDLKEAHGGLRDAVTLRGLLATWLVDVPSAELARLHAALLEIRDALHETTGRATDRLVADYSPDVASRLGLPDAEALRTDLVTIGRGVAHLASVALRNVDWILTPARSGSRRPVLDVLAPGVGAYRGEVVLTEKADPGADVLLGLRAAEAAASNGLVLTDAAAARLGRELAPMPLPWPAEGRSLFTRTLASGPPLVDVWESLDQYGVVDALLPEWRRVRYLAPQSPVHRYTVDRHLVQTCVEAAPLLSRVERPDILVVAAFLHDIGKGFDGDHCELGEPIAAGIASRIGFRPEDAALIGRLVRRHLLLIDAATTRDLDDPATVTSVADAVGDVHALDLLAVLTEADALATGPQAWSPWRRQLVDTLVERVRRHLDLGARRRGVLDLPDATRSGQALNGRGSGLRQRSQHRN